MATLFITEYEHMPETADGVPQVAKEPSVTTQTRSVSGASAQSAAFNARTKYVRLYTDTLCYIAFGTNPTAVTASSMPLPAGLPEYFGVTAEGSLKVAAIT